MQQIAHQLRSKFRGCMLGALLGDCLGAPFEGEFKPVSRSLVGNYLETLAKPETKVPYKSYTDDTAMTHCVAKSLIACKGFDAHDMAKKFVDEFFEHPRRGYGANVVDVFASLDREQFEDVYGPASSQFGGQGSYGNGAAMRTSPIALFNSCRTLKELADMTKKAASITHFHTDGINGAVLQTLAVHEALKSKSEEPLDAKKFLTALEKNFTEVSGPEIDPSQDEPKLQRRRMKEDIDIPITYMSKLKAVSTLLEKHKNPSHRDGEDAADEEVVQLLGNDVAALGSVPTAIFAVLHAQKTLPSFKTTSVMERVIAYCITLGGDTDTIASMAAAIAGAHVGEDGIPPGLLKHCEAADLTTNLADKLHEFTDK